MHYVEKKYLVLSTALGNTSDFITSRLLLIFPENFRTY